MDSSLDLTKSPLKKMFSSVFRRQDIQLSREPLHSIQKSSSNCTPLKTHIPVKVSYLQEPKPIRSSTPRVYNSYIDENKDPYKVKESIKSDLRYEELLKKYERMQEFYKSQLSVLAEEVDHYKELYQKVLKYKNIENY